MNVLRNDTLTCKVRLCWRVRTTFTVAVPVYVYVDIVTFKIDGGSDSMMTRILRPQPTA